MRRRQSRDREGVVSPLPLPDGRGSTIPEKAMIMTAAYEELVDFIASGLTPDSLVAFRPSEATRERVADLLHREKTGGLASEETEELNHYLHLEHVLRLAKARARQRLPNG